MVTARHNLIEYNGMKLVRRDARPISGDSGLLDTWDFALGSDKVTGATGARRIENVDKSAYIRHLLGYADAATLKPLKIVTNLGKGGAGTIIDMLSEHRPFKFLHIQHEADGGLPNGILNPLLPENRAATRDAVRAHGADFGIAWDGDFDLCFFIDAQSGFIESYYLVGLLATALLKRQLGGEVIHDPRLTWSTIKLVKQAGGIPMSKTSHTFIKDRMCSEDAIYGGEMSAHHYFRDFAYCDSGMIPWLLIAQLVPSSNRPLHDLVADCVADFPCSGEISFRVRDPKATIARVISYYAVENPRVDHTDGVCAEFAHWRFNLRSSNTELLLRLNVDTRGDTALLHAKTHELTALIGGSAPQH